MDAALRELSDQIDQATQRLLGTARIITDPDLRVPSMLPGWTRGHILAHLARNADGMRNVLVGVRTGLDRPAYASAEAREAAIERDAVPVAEGQLGTHASGRPGDRGRLPDLEPEPLQRSRIVAGPGPAGVHAFPGRQLVLLF